MECLIPYLYMVTVPHYNGQIRENVRSWLDYSSVGLAKFHCIKTV